MTQTNERTNERTNTREIELKLERMRSCLRGSEEREINDGHTRKTQ